MRHKVKKIKIKLGKDSNKMIMKKLLKNFIRDGKIVSTHSKAKLLKSLIERVVSRSKIDNEKNRAYLFKYLDDKQLVNFIFNNVNKVFSDINGGYVRLIKLNERTSDGALLSQLVWVRPIIKENPKVNQSKVVVKKENQ
ncbi:MAG: 50S ribosomal protein L17 [Microgenomates group bacterium]